MNQEKPIKVLMVCAMGMSSSLLESKTIEAARAAGVAFEMKSNNTPEMARWDFNTNYVDIVLVAPQVRFKRKSIAAAAKPYGVIVQDIDPVLFGMVEGEKLFRQIVAAVKARDGEA